VKTKFRTLLSLSLAAFMFLSACSSSPQGSASDPGADQSAPVSQNPVIPDSGDGPWYAGYGEPEYGGEIVFASNRFTEKLDIYTSGYSINFFFLEPLFMPDWTVDRNEYGFTTNFIPTEYYKGCLAESYEQPDLETVIVHLRQDVYWQDKEPVNGRQFVANDVVYHYSRLAGIGPFEGQDPSPQCGARLESIESITELDTFTVEFKFKEATPNNLSLLLDQDSYNYIMAPEVIDAGLGEDWEYAVGTGPWILTEMIPGNMVTFEKTPNYWGYDERYPENRLPYADTLKVMSVSESSTKLASLRTGQIDFADELTLQQYEILAESDTDLLIYQVPFIATNGLQLNMTHEPFDDINVRKALQMAIDRETMAAQYFGGTSPIPAGWVNPDNADYAYNYEEWSPELQAEYSYDPERAKSLLEEAGYPNGFSFTVLVGSNEDVSVLEILKAYFSAIGVEMSIDVQDPTTAQNLAAAKNYEAYWTKNTASGAIPATMVRMDYSTASTNYVQANDPEFDALCDELGAATTEDDIKRLCTACDQYVLEHHWGIRLFPTYVYNVSASYLHGYSGENLLRMGSPGGWFWARIWTTK
jgi:extracellular solute-binding protein, family 5